LQRLRNGVDWRIVDVAFAKNIHASQQFRAAYPLSRKLGGEIAQFLLAQEISLTAHKVVLDAIGLDLLFRVRQILTQSIETGFKRLAVRLAASVCICNCTSR
jgi:hypothetical protein